MEITRMRALAALAAAGTLAALAAGGALAVGKDTEIAAQAEAAAAEEVINACRHPNGGWVRIVSAATSCRAREQAVSWNVAGPAGPGGPGRSSRAEGRPGRRPDEARRPGGNRLHD
jgi:hypothetical protein